MLTWIELGPVWLSLRLAAVTTVILLIIGLPLAWWLVKGRSALCAPMNALGLGTLNFTFTGLVIGSVVYSLPFMIQPVVTAFEAIGPRPMEVAATLGCRPFEAFFRVILPLARHGIITGTLMTFAHTIGEFGVVLMIGGNIPGSTQVISTEIYTYVEAMEYGKAHVLAGGMLVFSFFVLLSLNLLNRKEGRTR